MKNYYWIILSILGTLSGFCGLLFMLIYSIFKNNIPFITLSSIGLLLITFSLTYLLSIEKSADDLDKLVDAINEYQKAKNNINKTINKLEKNDNI